MSSSSAVVVAGATGLPSAPPSALGLGGSAGPSGTELRLIPSDAVILLCRLGEGEFGEVYCGKLHLENGTTQDVAVKVSPDLIFLSSFCRRVKTVGKANVSGSPLLG